MDGFMAQDCQRCMSFLLTLDWPEIIILPHLCRKVGICSQVECQEEDENPDVISTVSFSHRIASNISFLFIFLLYHS